MKTRDILRRQCLTGIFFTLWGILWLALYYENLFGKLLSGFFIVFGIIIFAKNYLSFLLALFGLRVINEILFVALMGPVFAIASILYVWTYHKYEKGADENQD